MELELTKGSLRNTTIITVEGRTPVYEIETPHNMFKTNRSTVRKYQQDGQKIDIGTVELHGFTRDRVLYNGKEITPYRGRLFSSKQTFKASDEKEYKWRSSMGHYTLAPVDNDKVVIAHYETHKLSTKSYTLSITEEALGIADEIIITLVYARRLKDKDAQRGAAISAAASGGG